MDEEHPRTESSINNRSQLRLILHMEALYRDNKVSGGLLDTISAEKGLTNLSAITGSEFPPENVTGDSCEALHRGRFQR